MTKLKDKIYHVNKRNKNSNKKYKGSPNKRKNTKKLVEIKNYDSVNKILTS